MSSFPLAIVSSDLEPEDPTITELNRQIRLIPTKIELDNAQSQQLLINLLKQNRQRPPTASSRENLLFDRYNAIAYIKRFENNLIDYNFTYDIEAKKCRAFVRTITYEYRPIIQILDRFLDKSNPTTTSFKTLKIAFLKEYRLYNKRQIKATRTYLKRLSREFRNDNSNLKGYLREFTLATIDIPLAKLGNTERVSLLLSSIPDNLSYRVIRDLNLDTEDTETINDFKAVISAIRKEINYRINRSRILRKDKEKDIVKLV